MARPWRISLANSSYHVVSRGNGGEIVVHDDTDRQRFLGMVSEPSERFSAQIHAFVRMNHYYNLLVRCLGPNLSETLRWLKVSYSSRFSWPHPRRSQVLQGRFKLVLLLKECGFDEMGRYSRQ